MGWACPRAQAEWAAVRAEHGARYRAPGGERARGTEQSRGIHYTRKERQL